MLLLGIRDIRVNEQRIRLAVNGLHLVLYCVEELGLRPLDLTSEAGSEILHDNAVRACKEANDVLNKVALIGSELLPILHILAKVNLLGEPNHSAVILVLLPEISLLDRKENKPIVVLPKHGFWKKRRSGCL